MAVVPRGLGLVAALAVSGTALYFVYGYNKKKAFVNVKREKGSWRLECQYGGRRAIQQQQPVVTKESSGVCLALRDGEAAQIGEEIEWHQLPLFRKAILRTLSHERPSSLLLLPATPSSEPTELLLKGGRGLEECLKDRLVKCEADSERVNAFHGTLLSYTAEEQQQELREHDFATLVTSASGVSRSDSLGRVDSSEDISVVSSAADDCKTGEKSDECSGIVLESAASSGEGDGCSEAFLSGAASSSPSSRTLVGCFVRPGSGKTGNKPKKVVRFSPSVAEPSSNNQDYRSRCTAQMAQRAALQVRQRTHVPAANHADRSLAHDRPRLYSQAAKQPFMYSPHRYRGRPYYGS